MWKATIALCAVLLAWGCATFATARPFTVDDLLSQESLGALAIDPNGRWLVFERRGPYEDGRRFDAHFATGQTMGRLQVVDLLDPKPARDLLPADAGPGLLIGPFSPGGSRLAVYRFQDHAWKLGVVVLGTGAVRWFDITPAEPRRGRSLQWLSETEFLVIDQPDGTPPRDKREDWFVRERLIAAWDAAAAGQGAHTVLGSGAYAEVRSRGPARRLVRVDAEHGDMQPLAADQYIDLEVSPDHRRVALFRSGRDLQSRENEPVRGPAGLETEATELVVLDLASEASWVPCPGCDLLPNLLAWSPDSRSLLVFDRGDRRVWTTGDFLTLHVVDRRVIRLETKLEPAATENPVSVRAGWMGPAPIVHARPRGAGGRYDWFRLREDGAATNMTRALPGGDQDILSIDDRGITLAVGSRVWRVDAGGRARTLDAHDAALALRPSGGTQGSRLASRLPRGSWIVRSTGEGRELAWVEGPSVASAAPLPAGGALAAASRPGRALVLRSDDPRGVEVLSVARVGEPTRVVATLNARLAETDAPEVVPVRHRGPRGEPLVSWMLLPGGVAGAGPLPVIVRPYLGYNFPSPPRDLYMEQGFFQNLRMLTGHGYAVLVPSLPAPPGGMTDPAVGAADRILEVLAAAEAEPTLAGRFDPARAGLLGWSFGGYSTLAAITQTDRFRAAVAMDGISDLVDYWSTLPLSRLLVPEDGYGSMGVTGTVESTQPQLGVPPWRDPARYVRNSPLLAADRITTPLLLIHGGLDPIPMSGSVGMYSALFRQRKDALLVIYWGANHAVTAPGDVRDVWARTFSFLDEHLMPRPRTDPPSGSREPGSASTAPRPRRPPHS